MPVLTRTAVTPVWAGLILATAISWWLGHDQGLGADNLELATCLVMVVSFIKVRFVGLYFMELRHAPVWLRAAFEGWVVVVCAAVIGIYLVA